MSFYLNKKFNNRITQEDEATMRKLRSLTIDIIHSDNPYAFAPNGLFAFSMSPNDKTCPEQLQNEFSSILSHFYHWKYGSRWKNIENIQIPFRGIIELQNSGIYHFHLTVEEPDIVNLSIFGMYIFSMFKQLHHKASFMVTNVYDFYNWNDYTSSSVSHKDRTHKKRLEVPLEISSRLYCKNEKCLIQPSYIII